MARCCLPCQPIRTYGRGFDDASVRDATTRTCSQMRLDKSLSKAFIVFQHPAWVRSERAAGGAAEAAVGAWVGVGKEEMWMPQLAAL